MRMKLGFTCGHILRLHWMWVVYNSEDPTVYYRWVWINQVTSNSFNV